jgi:two-component system, OmpR family, phosphate regulon sensor histidine kinase PhoR
VEHHKVAENKAASKNLERVPTSAPDTLRSAIFHARVAIGVTAVVFALLTLAGLLPATVSIFGFVVIAIATIGQAYFTEERHKRDEARVLSRQKPQAAETGVGSMVFQQLPEAVVLLDEKARIVFNNRAAETHVGLSATGKLLQSTLREHALLEAVERVRVGGQAETIELVRSFPVERHYQAFIAPAETKVATPAPSAGVPILIVLHDNSDAKRVEQMRVDFVANASHELKTPLASLSGFIETLQGPAKDDTEARERFLVIMFEQTVRMQRLIEDLLSLSRIELREHLPPRGTVSLKALTKDVVEAIEPISTRDNVEIVVNIPDDLPSVRGDWDELHQVVQNLVDNAVKYGYLGEHVEVSALPALDETQVELSVRDYGPGIPREHIPRLTERFYRTDVATSRERGGTGLGLAIVKHILNRHGGELRVESTVGEGSTFTIQLPVAH